MEHCLVSIVICLYYWPLIDCFKKLIRSPLASTLFFFVNISFPRLITLIVLSVSYFTLLNEFPFFKFSDLNQKQQTLLVVQKIHHLWISHLVMIVFWPHRSRSRDFEKSWILQAYSTGKIIMDFLEKIRKIKISQILKCTLKTFLLVVRESNVEENTKIRSISIWKMWKEIGFEKINK